MSFTESERKEIYDRTSGYCHICQKKVAFTNYGVVGARGAWEVEHSNPRAEDGTDCLNNLYPACIPCNRSKGTQSTRTVRARNGKTRAPLSRRNRENAKIINAAIYALGAGGLTYKLYPPAAVIAGLVGLYMGYRRNPDK